MPAARTRGVLSSDKIWIPLYDCSTFRHVAALLFSCSFILRVPSLQLLFESISRGTFRSQSSLALLGSDPAWPLLSTSYVRHSSLAQSRARHYIWTGSTLR